MIVVTTSTREGFGLTPTSQDPGLDLAFRIDISAPSNTNCLVTTLSSPKTLGGGGGLSMGKTFAEKREAKLKHGKRVPLSLLGLQLPRQ